MLSRLRSLPGKTGFIEPCQPTLAKTAPCGPNWLHEIKHDGFRLMVRREETRVRLYTRNGFDWTDRYPGIAVAARMLLRARSFLIDGEVAVCNEGGLAVFDLLRFGDRQKPDAVLFAFDLLEINGIDLRHEPIEIRKEDLAGLLAAGGSIVVNEHLHGDGELVFRHACRLGCEGIVSKRLGSPYRSGRSRDWIKVKNPESPAVRRLEEEDWER